MHRGHNDNAGGLVTGEQKASFKKKLGGLFLAPLGGREGKGLSLLPFPRGAQVLFIVVVPGLGVVGLVEHPTGSCGLAQFPH